METSRIVCVDIATVVLFGDDPACLQSRFSSDTAPVNTFYFIMYLRASRTAIVTLAIRGSAHVDGYSQDTSLIRALPFSLMGGRAQTLPGK